MGVGLGGGGRGCRSGGGGGGWVGLEKMESPSGVDKNIELLPGDIL